MQLLGLSPSQARLLVNAISVNLDMATAISLLESSNAMEAFYFTGWPLGQQLAKYAVRWPHL